MASSSTFANILLQIVSNYSFYTGCIIFIGGIIGNALNVLVLTNLKLFRDNRSAFYLIVESIANLNYNLYSLALTTLTAIYGDDATGRSHAWCRFRYIWSLTCVLISMTMMCCAACDQFISTSYRLNLRQVCTYKIARYLAFVAPCIWLVHSILYGLSYDIQPSLGCVISNPIWSRYASFFLYPVLTGLLPVSAASLFSLLAFHDVRHIIRRQVPIVRRRLDQQMTAMVLIRAVFFVIFTFPYSIYRIYITNFPLTRTDLQQYANGKLLQAILLSISSVNFTV